MEICGIIYRAHPAYFNKIILRVWLKRSAAFALDQDGAAVQLYQFLRQRQPDSRARLLPARRGAI